jgi:tetratricopeptide (TPR) repeat protein
MAWLSVGAKRADHEAAGAFSHSLVTGVDSDPRQGTGCYTRKLISPASRLMYMNDKLSTLCGGRELEQSARVEGSTVLLPCCQCPWLCITSYIYIGLPRVDARLVASFPPLLLHPHPFFVSWFPMDQNEPAISERDDNMTALSDHETTIYEDSEACQLDEIEEARKALASCPLDHPDRAECAKSLGYHLNMRYAHTSDISLINEAIEVEREALALRPLGHPDRPNICMNLGASLQVRCEQTGDIALLDEAIELKREALALQPQGHPDQAVSCAVLAASLYVRYKQTGDITLLDEVIELDRKVLALRPPGHPDRAYSCGSLGPSLHLRYEQTGDVALLDEAIELAREALTLRPPGHPDRSNSFTSLAASLYVRYEQTGDFVLLDEAMKLKREALALQPPGHRDRASTCVALSASLHARYQQTGDIALLDEAIELTREALALQPLHHPDQANSYSNLGALLHARYEQVGDVVLLDEAIDFKRKAVVLQPSGHPDRPTSCWNLAGSLTVRYKQTGNVVLLDEAIEAYIDASEHSPAYQAWFPLSQLSQLHLCGPGSSPHYSFSKAFGYLQQSFQHGVDNIHRFISEVSYNTALMWDNFDVWTPHITALLVDVYAKMVDQLPLVAGFVLDTSSRLRSLKSTRRIGSDACVAALLAERPATAVTLLDRAHGIVWTQALHQRDPQMEGAPKDLAIELEDLLRAIAVTMPADPAILPNHPQDLRHRRNTRIQAILQEIRGMPGLARFMLGSTYETLREAARDHPVIVLVAAHGYAFALILASAVQDEPHTLRLDLTSDSLLSLGDSARQAGLRSRLDMRDGNIDERMRVQISKRNVDHQSFRVLADIWRKIVKPVIEHLRLEVSGGIHFP